MRREQERAAIREGRSQRRGICRWQVVVIVDEASRFARGHPAKPSKPDGRLRLD
jgi:hypothetical protein